MTDILTHDAADTVLVRATSVETNDITAYVFEGGTAPQFNINLAEPLVAGQSYTFSGEVTSISGGSIIGVCLYGGAGDPLTEVGPFSQTIVPDPAADGGTVFVLRGLLHTVGRLINARLDSTT